MNTQKIVRYITILALFLIPVFPLIVTDSLYYPFITGKAFYFRILVEVAFLGWIILAFFDAKYRPKFTSLTVAIAAFSLITLVADLLGANPLRSLWSNLERMEGWITIIHLWALYMILVNIFSFDKEDRKLWHRWLSFSLLIASIVAIYGFFQLFGWAQFHRDIGRLDATFGNAAYLAGYMIFNVFIALYLFIATKVKNTVTTKCRPDRKLSFRWLYILLAILFGFVIFGTQTRGAILGLVGGISMSLALYAIFGRGEPKRWRWVAVGIIGLFIMSGVIFLLNRDVTFVKDNQLLKRFASISINDASNQARLYIWPMALKGAVGRPVLGWGQENFNYIFQSQYNPAMFNMEQWFDRAHNVFLDWLVSSGIIGLLSYLILYVLYIVYVWKSSLSIMEKCILLGLLVAYFLNNLFVFDNLGSYVLFFAILAYANTFRNSQSIRWLVRRVRKDIVEYIIVPIMLLICIVVVYTVNVRQVRISLDMVAVSESCLTDKPNIPFLLYSLHANIYMTGQESTELLFSCVTRYYINPSVSYADKTTALESVKNMIRTQVENAPMNARSYYYAGSFLDQVGQFGYAEDYLARAHELSSTRQIISFELATSLIFQRKNDQALVILKQAYDSAPTYKKAAHAYAVALMIADKEEEARKIPSVSQEILNETKSYMSANQFYKAFVLFHGVVMVSQDFNVQLQQAEMEYSQGMTDRAIETLRRIGNSNPTFKMQVEDAIKQMQK